MSFFSILLYALAAVAGIQIICYLLIYSRFVFARAKKTSVTNTPVSVLVCAKNEAKELEQFLPSILSQNHTNFEIVLINDVSYDNTFEIMEAFAEKHACIKLVNVKNNEAFWGNKKYALTLGIKAATHENLLFINANSKPVSLNWITEMCAQLNLNSKKTVVLGYSAYNKVKHSVLNKFIRFDHLIKSIQYMSFAKTGMPYVGVSENLAYTKKHFFDANGFMSHMDIKKSEHALFINQTATKRNTSAVFSKNSFTSTVAPKSLKSWTTKKRQYTYIAKHFKLIHKFVLALIYSTGFLFWLLAILLISLQYNWEIVAAIIASRIVVQYIVLGIGAKKLNELDLIIFIPFLEIFLILFQFVIFITNASSKPKHWK